MTITGEIACSPPFGGIVKTFDGKILCGPGKCMITAFGQAFCSAEMYGSATITAPANPSAPAAVYRHPPKHAAGRKAFTPTGASRNIRQKALSLQLLIRPFFVVVNAYCSICFWLDMPVVGPIVRNQTITGSAYNLTAM